MRCLNSLGGSTLTSLTLVGAREKTMSGHSHENISVLRKIVFERIFTAWWNSGTSILLASWNYFLFQQIFGNASENLPYNPQHIDKWEMRANKEEDSQKKIKVYRNSFL
jgi:hypothetical protein